jgi:hypothetical protein
MPKSDACVPTGAPETCNNIDDDCNGLTDETAPPEVLARTETCGSCSQDCQYMAPENTIPTCTAGQCSFPCIPGAVNVEGGARTGCRCILNGVAEADTARDKPEPACDGLDNDCDGMTDEGFAIGSDLRHCGACNDICSFPFAMATCSMRSCTIGDCQPGYYNRDGNPANGCESPCQKTNGGAEVCDGLDNDCNGMVDDGVTPTLVCRGMSLCAGTAPACMGAQGWVCNYPAGFQVTEDTAGFGCDGRDNDCDGLTDEPFQVGTACSTPTSVKGECANTGTIQCVAGGQSAACNAVAKAAGSETCDGRDNDCDGLTDELATGDRTTDDRLMVLTMPGNVKVTMFAYEASRYDAGPASQGADSTRRPCSVRDKLPWSNVTKEDAQNACKAITADGNTWRLCSRDEWFAACNGKDDTAFPYGNNYNGTICNGADFPRQANQTTIPVGSATMCLSNQVDGQTADDLFDMSGNVKEWVTYLPACSAGKCPDGSNCSGGNPCGVHYELRGGAYNVPSFLDPFTMARIAPGLRCDAVTPSPSVPVRLPSVGFRCCRNGEL